VVRGVGKGVCTLHEVCRYFQRLGQSVLAHSHTVGWTVVMHSVGVEGVNTASCVWCGCLMSDERTVPCAVPCC
jgi:hypothetical protein